MVKDLQSGAIAQSLSGTGHLAKLPTVRGYMATQLFVLHPDMDVMAAVDILLQNRISGAPVVHRKTGELVGVLSEKDCLRLLSKGRGHDLPSGMVEEYMTTTVETIPPTMDIYYAAGLFLQNPYRRFPVVDDEGKLVGQVSRRDVLEAIRDNLKGLAG